jgi:prophage maintenance system killer protein
MTTSSTPLTRNELTEMLLGREIEIKFVSVQEAISLHDVVVGGAGGAQGAIDLLAIENALHAPMRACLFDGITDVGDLAQVLESALVQCVGFADGNDLTARVIAELFVRKNRAQ